MRATVYLVDDDAAVRRGLDRLLRGAGYAVEALPGGAEYLAGPAPAERSCLVLDIRMPGMSGFELQEAIAGTPHARPIVFITGHGDEEVRTRALSAGAVEVLFKPIDMKVLLDAVERALAQGSAEPQG
jgi:FixJ family two-component response regulator